MRTLIMYRTFSELEFQSNEAYMNLNLETETVCRRGTRRADIVIILLLCLMLALFAACGASMRVFTHADADFAYYEKVGVSSFRTMSSDRLAGDKFSIEFTTALLASEKFEVIDIGIFSNALRKATGSRDIFSDLTHEELLKIAELTGVQGVFEGTVSQYEMASSGGGVFPVISVEARLLDTATGAVVWMATITEKGGPKAPIIGIGETHTLGELAQKLSKKLASSID
jgi:hypothetical protein